MMTDTATYRRLRTWNLVLAVLHAAQAAVVLALATSFTLPVTGTFLQGPPGTAPGRPDVLFDVNVALGVAAFLFLSAIAHLTLTLPPVERWYRRHLDAGRNYARWIEYSVSASVMVVLIAMITGISDVAALIALFGVNAAMIFFGLVQERYERPGGSLLPFWLGSLVGVVPWVAIGIYLWGPGSTAQPPGFVYGIYASLFVFFFSFAANQWLQYRQKGKWRDYLVGERTYMVLSLTAKSALAWQVFASTLAG
jgi:hypothetical protein